MTVTPVSMDPGNTGDRDLIDGVTGDRAEPVRPTRPARAAIGAVHLYQVFRAGRIPLSPCRFTPSCSEYAVQALDEHGFRRGLRLIVGRLARCRPGGPYGADPVPPAPTAPRDL